MWLLGLTLLPLAAFAAAADNSSTPVETVVVQGQKLSVETKIDRKIYSVPEDAQSTLGTLSDILNVIPSVDVDPDGIVSLRGDSKVLILIDGKPATQLQGANAGDVLSVLGSSVFGASGVGLFLARLLILMVLSSAAASTQTTILPTARTTLSMAVYGALPKSFARMHPRYLTPTVSTIVMGAISILLYIPFNYLAGGNLIADAVTAIGLYIAFYYGLTGFACAWYYRKTLTSSARNLWMQGILPVLGGLLLYFAGIWSLWADWDVATGNSYTSWLMPFWPHWYIGGAFLIAFCAALAGFITGTWVRFAKPAFFRKETLTRATPTLVPDEG